MREADVSTACYNVVVVVVVFFCVFFSNPGLESNNTVFCRMTRTYITSPDMLRKVLLRYSYMEIAVSRLP